MVFILYLEMGWGRGAASLGNLAGECRRAAAIVHVWPYIYNGKDARSRVGAHFLSGAVREKRARGHFWVLIFTWRKDFFISFLRGLVRVFRF